jgi:hypothetical protein
MINQSDHPVAWALLLYALDEVREHVEQLTEQRAAAGSIDERDFAVQVGHLYAHLNRIWNGRNEGAEEGTEEQWATCSRFPRTSSRVAEPSSGSQRGCCLIPNLVKVQEALSYGRGRFKEKGDVAGTPMARA